jgi:hypothetical protein
LDNRPVIFKQIHDIVFFGNGGYDWNTVYNMPLWLRRTTFNLMKEYYDKQKEEADNQQAMLQNKKSEVFKPNVNSTPTYTTKAPKK